MPVDIGKRQSIEEITNGRIKKSGEEVVSRPVGRPAARREGMPETGRKGTGKSAVAERKRAELESQPERVERKPVETTRRAERAEPEARTESRTEEQRRTDEQRKAQEERMAARRRETAAPVAEERHVEEGKRSPEVEKKIRLQARRQSEMEPVITEDSDLGVISE
ncbi:MAG: hypothetical protein ACYC27_20300 [Armatimonadota bacterium]